MATWEEFFSAAPELANFAEERLRVATVAYLATVRRDGGPRVHPVSPDVMDGHLLVFMEPTSPKGKDLRRDPRYSLHTAVADSTGAGGEFFCTGEALLVLDDSLRQRAAGSTTPERYILFDLQVSRALKTIYQDKQPHKTGWSEREGFSSAIGLTQS